MKTWNRYRNYSLLICIGGPIIAASMLALGTWQFLSQPSRSYLSMKVAIISLGAFIAIGLAYIGRRRDRELKEKLRELSELKQDDAQRIKTDYQGRVKSQIAAFRKELIQKGLDALQSAMGYLVDENLKKDVSLFFSPHEKDQLAIQYATLKRNLLGSGIKSKEAKEQALADPLGFISFNSEMLNCIKGSAHFDSFRMLQEFVRAKKDQIPDKQKVEEVYQPIKKEIEAGGGKVIPQQGKNLRNEVKFAKIFHERVTQIEPYQSEQIQIQHQESIVAVVHKFLDDVVRKKGIVNEDHFIWLYSSFLAESIMRRSREKIFSEEGLAPDEVEGYVKYIESRFQSIDNRASFGPLLLSLLPKEKKT